MAGKQPAISDQDDWGVAARTSTRVQTADSAGRTVRRLNLASEETTYGKTKACMYGFPPPIGVGHGRGETSEKVTRFFWGSAQEFETSNSSVTIPQCNLDNFTDAGRTRSPGTIHLDDKNGLTRSNGQSHHIPVNAVKYWAPISGNPRLGKKIHWEN